MRTYISLFSNAGIGCYGFKQSGFECIATNELIGRRLDIQRYNSKCRYDSGYIQGDITQTGTKEEILAQISLYKANFGITDVDVVIATPPCQGMSVANQKKQNELGRNSLIVEAIRMIEQIKPRFFVFENVPQFVTSCCLDTDNVTKMIPIAIQEHLNNYKWQYKLINFKDYGSNSSRKRCLVIGAREDVDVDINELFPKKQDEHTLRETIGRLPRLEHMGEISSNDIYHGFRKYNEYMREWVHDLKEGESAFDNPDESKRPYQIINGERVPNKNKMQTKYRRQYWDKPGYCVHTRNDIFSSQSTIHPSDDRVMSIRELMILQTVPYEFKWSNIPFDELNQLPIEEKVKYLKKNEINIRQTLGESVPTIIFKQIADVIKKLDNIE